MHVARARSQNPTPSTASATANTTSSGYHTSGHQPPASTAPAHVALQQSRVLDAGGREAGRQGGRDLVAPAPAQARVPARGWIAATPSSVPAAACTAVSRPKPAVPPQGVQASGGGGASANLPRVAPEGGGGGGGGAEGGGARGGGGEGGGRGGKNVPSSRFVCNMYVIDCPDDVTEMNDGPTAKVINDGPTANMARHDGAEISGVTSRQPLDASSVQAAAYTMAPQHHEHAPDREKRSSDAVVPMSFESRCSHTVANMSRRWDDPASVSFR